MASKAHSQFLFYIANEKENGNGDTGANQNIRSYKFGAVSSLGLLLLCITAANCKEHAQRKKNTLN